MKRWLTAAALVAMGVVIAGHTAHGQQAPTFRSGVSLVTVDVTVLDKDGKPVPGLTADDLDIKLNGKSQPIRALAFVQAAAPGPVTPAPALPAPPPAAAPQPAPAPAMTVAAPAAVAVVNPSLPRVTYTNAGAPKGVKPPPMPETPAAATPEPPAPVAPAPVAATAPAAPSEARVFILLVDDLSISPQRGKSLFAAASRFLDRLPATDLVGYTTTQGVGTVNPTRDRALVKAALTKAVGAFSDPRGISKSGPTGSGNMGGSGGKGGGSPDGNLGIDESIDIERGNDALLKDVIARECYNGDRSIVNSMSVGQLMSENDCASEVQREARRVAALARQNKLRQIESIKAVVAAMKAANGIRHLILITDGLPVSREVNDLDQLVKSAALAGVQLSVMLEEPDLNMADEGRRQLPPDAVRQADMGASQRRREDDKLMLNGVQTLNDMLGGTFYRVIGNADPFFDRVIIASSAVYRLGVELPSGTQPGKEFTVTVSVKKPGLSAKANKFAIAAADAPPAAAPEPPKPAAPAAPAPPKPAPKPAEPTSAIDEVLKAAVYANTAVGDVPLRAATTVRRSNNGAGLVDVSLNLHMPASVKAPLTAFIGVVDAKGGLKINRRIIEAAAGDYTIPYLFPLEPGDYHLRVAIADATGALGALDVPVHAALAPYGEFTAGDILTYVVDANDRAQLFTLDDVPPATTLYAALEIYTPGAMPVNYPVVEWSLLKEGDSRPMVDADSPARPASALMRSDAQFPWDKLPAGTYVIRADLIVDDKVAATRSVVVKKR